MSENLAETLDAISEDSRVQTASDGVYERLRHDILCGKIRPNTPLIETDLAAALRVSRTPVRESLQRLAADELIVPRKRGWAVREYSAREVRERYETRVALEGYAARLAAHRATAEEIEAIAAIQALRDAQAEPDQEFRASTNYRFHAAIIAAARNDILAMAIQRAAQFYFNERIAARTSLENYQANQADHQRIVAALRARDGAAAEEAMRTHIGNIHAAFLRISSLEG